MQQDLVQAQKFDGTWDAEVKHDGPDCLNHATEYYPIILNPDRLQLPLNPATGEIKGYYPMLPGQKPIFLSGQLNETEGSGEWYNGNTGCSGTWAAIKRSKSTQAPATSPRNPGQMLMVWATVLMAVIALIQFLWGDEISDFFESLRILISD